MSKLLGHVWKIVWGNPYTSPPDGWPRVLAEMFVPVSEPGAGSGDCPSEIVNYPRPRGYSVCCAGIEEPPKPLAHEKLASNRCKRLEARERKRHPLFAEQFVAERIAAQPDYFAGTDQRPGRDQELADWRARIEYLTAHANELMTYG